MYWNQNLFIFHFMVCDSFDVSLNDLFNDIDW